MDSLLNYFLLFALVVTTVLIVRGAVAHVTSALRNGRLRMKDVVYARDQQPTRFWLAVLFWVALSAFMLVVNVYAMLAVFRTDG